MINAVFGLIASIVSGMMADKLEKKTLWAKSLVLMVFQSLAIPIIFVTCKMTNNFWMSIASYALYHTFASTYAGPSLTMM